MNLEQMRSRLSDLVKKDVSLQRAALEADIAAAEREQAGREQAEREVARQRALADAWARAHQAESVVLDGLRATLASIGQLESIESELRALGEPMPAGESVVQPSTRKTVRRAVNWPDERAMLREPRR